MTPARQLQLDDAVRVVRELLPEAQVVEVEVTRGGTLKVRVSRGDAPGKHEWRARK